MIVKLRKSQFLYKSLNWINIKLLVKSIKFLLETKVLRLCYNMRNGK